MSERSPLLSERELVALEREHPGGLTAHQILDLLAGRGAPLSEATFRKYVQLGLLPRSRRVRLPGGQRGSQGLYPATTVRRLLAVRALMSASYTMDEIRRRMARTVEVEALRQELEGVLRGFAADLQGGQGGPSDDARGRAARQALEQARRSAAELLGRIDELERFTQATTPKRPTVAVPPPAPRLGAARS